MKPAVVRDKHDAAMKKALENARIEFEKDFGVKNQATVAIRHNTPEGNGGLQAVDYFLWALQRFYEYERTDRRESECRYVELIREHIGEINDLDYLFEGRRDVLWGPHRPLGLTVRTGRAVSLTPRF